MSSKSIKVVCEEKCLNIIYSPAINFDVIEQNINDGTWIKGTFWVNKTNIVEINQDDESICFTIAKTKGNYYLLDREVFGIKHNISIEKKLNISDKWFITYPKTSVIKKIDELLQDDLCIVADENGEENYLPSRAFLELIEVFPNSYEVKKYVSSRISYLLSTYVEALPQLVNRTTGRIHTSFNQAVTATGRLSSSNPNLQNIPIRDEDGKEIRKAFIPDTGCEFFSADYSQIELRIMAHLSEDKNMIDAFLSGHDIHAATAAKIYKIDINDVTADMRRKAKTANFGIIYGISVFGLAERMGVSRQEAKELIDGYFETYPQVKEYMDKSIQVARENGYVETIFHRKRFLPDINSRNSHPGKCRRHHKSSHGTHLSALPSLQSESKDDFTSP